MRSRVPFASAVLLGLLVVVASPARAQTADRRGDVSGAGICVWAIGSASGALAFGAKAVRGRPPLSSSAVAGAIVDWAALPAILLGGAFGALLTGAEEVQPFATWLVLLAPALILTELALIPASVAAGWGRQKLAAIGEVIRWLPRLLRERRQVQATRNVSAAEFAAWLTPDLDSPFISPLARSWPARFLLRTYWRAVRALLGRR